MSHKTNQLEMITKRFHQKMSDLAVLKMHITRDEQETLNEFVDDIKDLFLENKLDELEDIFRTGKKKYLIKDLHFDEEFNLDF